MCHSMSISMSARLIASLRCARSDLHPAFPHQLPHKHTHTIHLQCVSDSRMSCWSCFHPMQLCWLRLPSQWWYSIMQCSCSHSQDGERVNNCFELVSVHCIVLQNSVMLWVTKCVSVQQLLYQKHVCHLLQSLPWSVTWQTEQRLCRSSA